MMKALASRFRDRQPTMVAETHAAYKAMILGLAWRFSQINRVPQRWRGSHATNRTPRIR
jgi:hypothetical protein